MLYIDATSSALLGLSIRQLRIAIVAVNTHTRSNRFRKRLHNSRVKTDAVWDENRVNSSLSLVSRKKQFS